MPLRPLLHRLAVRATSRTLTAAWAVAAACAMAPPHAQASESMRCNGRLVGKGEPLVALLQKCGEPVFRHAVCVPMLQLGWVALPYRPYGPGAVLANQCVPMEEWTYDRGDGNFLGVVRVHNGTIESVRSGPRLR